MSDCFHSCADVTTLYLHQSLHLDTLVTLSFCLQPLFNYKCVWRESLLEFEECNRKDFGFFFNVWQVSANLSKSGTQEAGLITEPAQPSTSIFAGAYVGQTFEIDCEDYCLFIHCCWVFIALIKGSPFFLFIFLIYFSFLLSFY